MAMPPTLGAIIARMRPTGIPFEDYEIRDDGAGPYIVVPRWNVAKLGPIPTEAQVLAEQAAFDAAQEQHRIDRQQAVTVCKNYNRTTATAAEVRNTLGAALFLLREVIREIR